MNLHNDDCYWVNIKDGYSMFANWEINDETFLKVRQNTYSLRSVFENW
ncbi:hypothetical protein GNE08_11335 [Trichormus variabilis ARAD]|uniref:Uncharacterized protein n=1 Tax=Trichormus variabilis N2B TaxID=2681315 RepID=A0ABR6S9Y8_ANAVA|nr:MULTISPECIES: hypothetical protein [Nostocaceae]MBC1214815.1 hypothetical protein [Trichormus variabilis ARAD]MBC1254175.1 hypothetical protein [Trichormus variabilis V5]MBC1267255.1 hypothetical protein [Trichormus variabilis FSR]MBC1303231.1 hypothetical protein [Trichormus variabilis N2B]MBC1311165.1 hypothetical protein [Trichormus variabilis PNB]